MTRTASDKKPLAAALEFRLPVFPVVKMQAPRTADTQWGGVYVERGAPTARHRDVLDAILITGQRVSDRAGQLHVIFDFAEVRRLLQSETDWRGIRKMLLDLAGTVISLRQPGRGWPPAFPLLTFVGESNCTADRAGHQFPAKLKRITLSAGAATLLAGEARVCMSRGTVERVLSLQHQISRSLARWCLSHSREQHHHLASVLVAIGAAEPGEPISGREARRGVRERVSWLREDAAALAELGIDLDGETLHYRKKRGVFIDTTRTGVEPLTAAVEPLTAAVEPLTAVIKGMFTKETFRKESGGRGLRPAAA